MEKGLLFLPMILCFTCSCHEMIQNVEHLRDTISYEKVSYFKHPVLASDKPFRYRLTYYYENGEPHRWMELDDSGRVITDYIYEYDSSWTQTGARYREESAVEFSIEKVRFESDSTKITEWIDSTGRVYYKMIDNLNADGKTYRASFIGDKLHGYDSTFYTEEGFVKRIFFTNTKGKTYNDRSFNYDSLNQNGDWTIRTKVMADTIREIHEREVYYDNWFITGNGKFYEGILSTGELSENVINFSMDESIVFLTRTSNWTEQTAFIAYNKSGVFTEATPIRELGDIYNGAISPKGDKIIFSVKDQDNEDIWLIKKKDGQWSDKMNLTKSSHLQGGYFYWFSDTEIYFYQNKNNGDIFVGEIDDGKVNGY